MQLDWNDFVGALMLLIACAGNAATTDAINIGQWRTFTNEALDYSFRYPPDLRLKHRPVTDFGIEGLVEAVDLVWGPESIVVLRVLVVEANGNPRVTVFDSPMLQNVCRTYEEFFVGGRLAVNCVSCGRGACGWTVYVPGSHEFRMLTLTSARERQRPEDGRFPIRTILSTFRWHLGAREKQ